MKQVIFFFLFFSYSYCYSQDWQFLFEVELDTYYYKPNNKNTAWVKVISEKTEYFPSKSSLKTKSIDGYKIQLWKFDCLERQIGLIKSTTYSKEGKPIHNYSLNELLVEMDYVNPDSIGETLLSTFCTKE